MTPENDVLAKLVIDERDSARDLGVLVDKASKIFRIEKASGRIVFTDYESLSDKKRIVAVLVGKYFACHLGIVADPALGVSELGEELNRPATALSGPLKNLLSAGYIVKNVDRKYKIAYHRINEVFEKVLI